MYLDMWANVNSFSSTISTRVKSDMKEYESERISIFIIYTFYSEILREKVNWILL